MHSGPYGAFLRGGLPISTLMVCLFSATGCRGPMLSVDDAVNLAGSRTNLTAYLGWEPVMSLRLDIAQVPVDFFVNGEKVGTATTDRRGIAVLETDVGPDTTNFEVAARVDGRDLRADGRVFQWDRDRLVIILDVDNTIELTDYRRLLLTNEIPQSKPFDGSVDALQELAKRYYIVYMSGRTRGMLAQTRGWLQQSQYPDGPVIVMRNLRQMIFQGTFKKQRLAELRKTWPTLLIGIGDKPLDSDAYGQNKLLSLMVKTNVKHDFGEHAYVFDNWRDIAAFFREKQFSSSDELSALIASREPLYKKWRGM
jgi:hypothetical protein